MRFGQQLRTSLIRDYYYYYIAYDDLKEALQTPYETEPTADNPQPKRRAWTEEDEKAFVTELESELDKVFTFQRVKSEEIVRRIRASEKEVNDVIARLDNRRPDDSIQLDEGDDGKDDVPTEEGFMLLEEDLSDIIADVHDLAKFTQLNYTGFQKIIKKHDVRLPVGTKGEGWNRALTTSCVETNLLAPKTSICGTTKSEAFLQRQLRCVHCQAVEAL